MKLVIDCIKPMYVELSGEGDHQLHIVTVIGGIRKEAIVDAYTDTLYFYDKSKQLVGKLKFFEEKKEGEK